MPSEIWSLIIYSFLLILFLLSSAETPLVHFSSSGSRLFIPRCLHTRSPTGAGHVVGRQALKKNILMWLVFVTRSEPREIKKEEDLTMTVREVTDKLVLPYIEGKVFLWKLDTTEVAADLPFISLIKVCKDYGDDLLALFLYLLGRNLSLFNFCYTCLSVQALECCTCCEAGVSVHIPLISCLMIE